MSRSVRMNGARRVRWLASPSTPVRHRLEGFGRFLGVWLYCRFCLSYRDVEELLFARGRIGVLAYQA